MRWCSKALPQGMNFWVLSFVGLTYMASRFVGEILFLMHLYSVFVSLLSSNQMQGVYACIRNSELVLGNLSMLTFTVKEVLLSNRITSWSHLSTIATSSNFLGAFYRLVHDYLINCVAYNFVLSPQRNFCEDSTEWWTESLYMLGSLKVQKEKRFVLPYLVDFCARKS